MNLPSPFHAFASDNVAGLLPEAVAAVAAASVGTAAAYGEDRWTAQATAAFEQAFGRPVTPVFTFGGTGANLVALGTLCRPHQAVVASDHAHLAVDECGGPERFAGIKVLTGPTSARGGRLNVADVHAAAERLGDVHAAQPHVVSVTQPTELGVVYRPGELAALCHAAHGHGFLVHVDGARLANAAAALDAGLGDVSFACGADAVCFGGTKAGLMAAEVVLFADAEAATAGRYVAKQAGQLASKQRFPAVQFSTLLEGELWRRTADRANAMAARLAARLEGVIRLAHPQETNAVFARLPAAAADELHGWTDFFDWGGDVVRWMTSFATTPEDVDRLVAGVSAAIKG